MKLYECCISVRLIESVCGEYRFAPARYVLLVGYGPVARDMPGLAKVA